MALSVSTSRVQQLLGAWEQLTAGQEAQGACTVVFCVAGEITATTVENQRGQAVVQYLLSAPAPLSCVSAVLTRSDVLFIVADGAALPAVSGEAPGVRISAVSLSGAEAAISEVLQRQTSAGAVVVGRVRRELEIQEGQYATDLVALLNKLVKPEDMKEAGPLLGELLFGKDSSAVECVDKAARLCNTIFRQFTRGLLEKQLHKTNPQPLSVIREELCSKLDVPNTIQGLDGLDSSSFSATPGLPTSVMHRGTYQSQIQTTEVSTDPLHADVVIVRYGKKCLGYTAFFARTLIVKGNAPKGAIDSYTFVHSVSDKTIQSLQVGRKLSEVHQEVMAFARSQNAKLAGNLLESLGFSTGLLVLEARGSISEKGTAVVENGMCFVVRIVAEKIVDEESGNQTYDLELSDTVIVANGRAELKTKGFRKPEEIEYEMEEEESEEDGAAAAVAGANGRSRDLARITRQGKADVPLMSRASERQHRLRELLKELHAQYLEEGKSHSDSNTNEFKFTDAGRISVGELSPYPAGSTPPPATADGKIFVDMDRMAVWFPIMGTPCAFHVCTINRLDVKAEGTRYSLVVVFGSLQEAYVGYRLNRTKVFLKELTYTSARDTFSDVVMAIRTLQQKAKNAEVERVRNAGAASNGKLMITPNGEALRGVKIRPPAAASRKQHGCVGNLELHRNGLRFSFLGGAGVDIMFDNIKHIIFQPSENSVYVIYHIILNKAIPIGSKPWDQVQFLWEVMESSEALDGTRRSFEDEEAIERRDEARAMQFNRQFRAFAAKVEEVSHIPLELPYSSGTFTGVHSRAMTTFKGSSRVLWAIIDWPPFYVSVEDIEVVVFERVQPGGKEFDLALVPRNYNKNVVNITAIPSSSMEAIQDWCLKCRLYYTEVGTNVAWRVLMKEIRDDPEWMPFLPGAGWSVLNDERGEEDEEDDEDDDDDDSTFASDEEEESDEDDDTASSWESDDETDESSRTDDGSDEESALSWDEAERRAEHEDRKRGYGDADDDEDRPRKKPRVAPAQPPANARGTSSYRPPPPQQQQLQRPPQPQASRPPAKAMPKSSIPPPRRF